MVSWFSWLILYDLYGSHLMAYMVYSHCFNSNGLNNLILHGLYINDIMVYSS